MDAAGGVVRVRLKFDSSPANYARKCWFMFDREKCRLVGDVSHLLASHFSLKRSQGIQLFMDDFLVPTNESALLIRDNDTIQVKMVSKPLESESTSSSSNSEDERNMNNARAKRSRVKKSTDEVRTAKAKGNKTPQRSASVKELVGVTKQSASGGLHTKFQSSSSSSSSDTSSDSSDSNSHTTKTTHKEKVGAAKKVGVAKKAQPISQWDVKAKGAAATASSSVSAGLLTPENIIDGTIRTLLSGGSVGRGRGRGVPVGGARGRGMGEVGRGARGRGRSRNRRKKTFPSDVIVGGPDDILTTKNALYTSFSDAKNSSTSAGKELAASNSTNSNQGLKKVTPLLGASMKKEVVTAMKKEVVTAMKKEVVTAAGEASTATSDQAGECAANGEEESKEESKSVEAEKDYSTCPELQGPPRVGDNLAFKILQLSSTYSPEVSDFLEASVLSVEEKSVKLRYTDATMAKLMQKAKEDNNSGKFQLPDDAEFAAHADDSLLDVPQEVELPINDLLVPKLIR